MNFRVIALVFSYWGFWDGNWFLVRSGKVNHHMAEVSLLSVMRFFESGDSEWVIGTDWLPCSVP